MQKAVQNSIVFWRLKLDQGVERNPWKDRVAQKLGRAKPEGKYRGKSLGKLPMVI